MDEVDNFLAHYGVKGMRWGIRKKEESGTRGTSSAEKIKPSLAKKKVSELRGSTEVNDAAEKKGLSRNQKLILAGVGVAAAAGIAYGGYRLYETGSYNQLIMKGQAFVHGEKTPKWKTKPELADKNMSADDIFQKVAMGVNPDYGKPGTVNNCLRSSFAHEIRRRGHDVEVTRSFKATGQSNAGIAKALGAFKGGVNEDTATLFAKLSPSKILPDSDGRYAEKVFGDLASHPERARGSLNVFWKSGGGHSVSWEIIGGKPVIFDSQTGRMYKEPWQMLQDYGENFSGADAIRLDNVDLNPKFLSRWVKNA